MMTPEGTLIDKLKCPKCGWWMYPYRFILYRKNKPGEFNVGFLCQRLHCMERSEVTSNAIISSGKKVYLLELNLEFTYG